MGFRLVYHLGSPAPIILHDIQNPGKWLPQEGLKASTRCGIYLFHSATSTGQQLGNLGVNAGSFCSQTFPKLRTTYLYLFSRWGVSKETLNPLPPTAPSFTVGSTLELSPRKQNCKSSHITLWTLLLILSLWGSRSQTTLQIKQSRKVTSQSLFKNLCLPFRLNQIFFPLHTTPVTILAVPQQDQGRAALSPQCYFLHCPTTTSHQPGILHQKIFSFHSWSSLFTAQQPIQPFKKLSQNTTLFGSTPSGGFLSHTE